MKKSWENSGPSIDKNYGTVQLIRNYERTHYNRGEPNPNPPTKNTTGSTYGIQLSSIMETQ